MSAPFVPLVAERRVVHLSEAGASRRRPDPPPRPARCDGEAGLAGATRLVAVGVSHQTAPLALRERLALDPAAVHEQLRYLCAEVCDEALIISTCNRFELYAVVGDAAAQRLRAWWHGLVGTAGGVGAQHVREFDQDEAIEHLFQVASSLDSLVLGEPQILGQVKDAVRLSEQAGALGRTLGHLARRALAVAKRVRTETAIGRSRVGIGNAGVELARRVCGRLDGCTVLLVGVGAMGRQVAKALLAAGVARLLVANRTFAHARALAAECGGEPIELARIESALVGADIVIAATSSASPILGPETVRRALRQRPARPLFCIDLAVPRNIDPAVAAVANCRLFDVDDLAAVVEHGRAAREESCREALRIVAEEKAEFLRCRREVELGPAIGRITRAAETLRRRELARCQRLSEALSPAQAELFESMSRTLTNKLLDGPLRAIRHAARDGDDERLRRLLAQWDGLDPF